MKMVKLRMHTFHLFHIHIRMYIFYICLIFELFHL